MTRSRACQAPEADEGETGDAASTEGEEAPAAGHLTQPGTSASGERNRLRALLRAGSLPIAVVAVLAAGTVLRLLADPAIASRVWFAGLVFTGLPIALRTLRGIVRREFAADIVASLAIVTAVALYEPLAGLMIVLMQSGGEAMERYAAGRASDAVRMLEEAAPRLAHRKDHSGRVDDIPVGEIRAGDALLVRPGELFPCDGAVIGGHSHVDASRITGEPLPVRATPGTILLSGSANGEGPILMRSTAVAGESQYARIVEMVRAAQESKAPIQRLADRYAIWFTPVTIVTCVVAWLISGDMSRTLAVLVVATPCPLILAAPVAIIGGINRAARQRVIFRNGTALEQLAGVTAAVFDKTGTLTIGRPRVRTVHPVAPFTARDLLGLAASIEQGSSHLLARMVVEAARENGIRLAGAARIVEAPGQGVSGNVSGRHVVVGARPYVEAQSTGIDHQVDNRAQALQAFVAVDGAFAGTIEYADRLRPGIDRLVASLKGMGLRRTLLLSGDRNSNTQAVARAVGISEADGDLLPADKVLRVVTLEAAGEKVMMVGDGINDAPALSAARVGVALAGQRGGLTAEAADVVLLADDVTLVVPAIRIARHAMRVARQSIWVGLGLSATAMLVAAFGFIPPAAGALLQEGIDVTVILNALRASRAPRDERRRIPC